MQNTSPRYRGRFAPSPTGPLHLGSLIAALASFLDARHVDGTWLVRMEDLDPPREEPGAAQCILESLQHHGMHWDENVLYQSEQHAAYELALDQLAAQNHLFHCDCSRSATGVMGNCCGTCRQISSAKTVPHAVRVSVPDSTAIQFNDLLHGPQPCALGRVLPDFIVRRKDELYAYQLAVVVDDAMQGITHVVRGSDLLDSTARQIFLQGVLDYSTPRYLHIPVIANTEGQKFSKQHHAPALENARATQNLRDALQFLGQANPPQTLRSVDEILAFAIGHWDRERLPRAQSLTPAEAGLLYPPDSPA